MPDAIAFSGQTPYGDDPQSAERVSERLRSILAERALPDDPNYVPQILSPKQITTLRAVLAHVIPQTDERPIDLAARLDRMMAEADGNGWRYEALPEDREAYRLALDTIAAGLPDGVAFSSIPAADQHAVLAAIDAGWEIGEPGVPRPFDTDQMRLWFEELRSDAVRLYAAHPDVMASIGYSGAMNGAQSGAGFAGFARVGGDERQVFEPVGDGRKMS